MAQYDVNYSCGHGSISKQLFGKTSDRVQKIAWYERNLVCPDCFKSQKRIEDENEKQIAYVEAMGARGAVTIRASGRIEANKDALKAMGFGWTSEYGGLGFYLSTTEPPLALVISHTYTTPVELSGWYTDLEIKLSDLGYEIKNNINELDFEMLCRTVEQNAAKAAENAAKRLANPRPKRPGWYDALMTDNGSTRRCNGKLYGKINYWRIYVSNVEHRLTNEQAAEFGAYFKSFSAWKAIP
jgi:hypothetical protein